MDGSVTMAWPETPVNNVCAGERSKQTLEYLFLLCYISDNDSTAGNILNLRKPDVFALELLSYRGGRLGGTSGRFPSQRARKHVNDTFICVFES